MKPILLLLALLTCSCIATTADLNNLATRIGARLEDADDRESMAAAVIEEIDSTVDQIERRAEQAANGVLGYGAAGDMTGITGLGMTLLHLWRNQTRKKLPGVTTDEAETA